MEEDIVAQKPVPFTPSGRVLLTYWLHRISQDTDLPNLNNRRAQGTAEASSSQLHNYEMLVFNMHAGVP